MTRLVARLIALFHRRRLDAELTDELSAHLDFAAAENLARGMSPADARRAAALRFGGSLQTAEAYRDQRGFPLLESIAHDIRYALRGMRRSPAFTVVAVLTLGVGIGINGAVFIVTNATLFQGFRHLDNERLLYLHTQDTHHPLTYGYGVSYADFRDWQAQSRAFTGMAASSGSALSISDDKSAPERGWATRVSANAFGLLEQRPLLGRDFVPSDAAPAASPVAILSHRLWSRRFGGDPTIVGQTVRIDGVPTTVIGVMPDGFIFPNDDALWMPLASSVEAGRRDIRNISVVGKLADGVGIDTARAEMSVIAERLATIYPSDKGFVPLLWNFRQSHTGGAETVLYASMWGAVGFVLLIACANLANLTLARATSRTREIALRVTLGAGRARVARQLLTESVLLSSIGGLLGGCLATWSARVYELATFHGVSWYNFRIGGRVLGYIAATSIGAGLLFGAVAALRCSSIDVHTALKDGGHGATAGRSGKRLSGVLVTAEMALAVVLLASAGLMTRSFLNIYRADLGVRTVDVFSMSVTLPERTYPSPARRIAFVDRLTAALEATPGIESIGIANTIPTGQALKLQYDMADGSSLSGRDHPPLPTMVVDAGYFGTLRVSVRAGRAFSGRDSPTSAPVAIVNQQFADTYWPGADPLAKRIRLVGGADRPQWLSVVGVVSNVVQDDPDRQTFEPLIYLPYRQHPTAGIRVLACARLAPESVSAAFRSAAQRLDPDLPVGVSTLPDALPSGNVTGFDVNVIVFLIFAATALLLASLGLYAVVAYAVSQRTREIGVRIAIGATGRDVLRLVVGQGLQPVAVGLALGLTASFAVTPMLRSVLVNVSPADPLTFVAGSGVLILAALLGCAIPARRATRVDPVVALRHD